MAWVYDQDLSAYGDFLTPFPHFVVGVAALLIVASVVYGLFIN